MTNELDLIAVMLKIFFVKESSNADPGNSMCSDMFATMRQPPSDFSARLGPGWLWLRGELQ